MKRVADSCRRRGVKGISGLIYEESGGVKRISGHERYVITMFCTILTDLQTLPSHSRCTLFKFLLAASRQRISGLIYEDGCGIHIVMVVSNVSPVLSMKRVVDCRFIVVAVVSNVSLVLSIMKRVAGCGFTLSWWCQTYF